MTSKNRRWLAIPFLAGLLGCPGSAQREEGKVAAVDASTNARVAAEADVKSEVGKSAMEHYADGNKMILTGQFEEAIASFEEALEIDPKLYDAHRGLGICHARLGNKDEAVKNYEAYIEGRPHAEDSDKIREIITKLKTKE